MAAVQALNVTLLAAPAEDRPMRAAVYRQYGTPEVLGCEDVARPVPGDADVLVQVLAAGATVGDYHVVTGKPYLIRVTPFGGLPGPKHPVPGQSLAGRVVAVGAKVTAFQVGDEVFGQANHGAFATCAVVPAALLAIKPASLSFAEAACVPWAATALQAFRAGGLVAGQKVLINGASGGVGTWAVQIAKALGAEVTAVCSTRNLDMVRALGADMVIDYTAEDFAQGGARFDMMLDLVGDRPLADCLAALGPRGTYVPCSGGGGDWVGPIVRLLAALIRTRFTGQRLANFIMAPNQADLGYLKDLVEAGQARPVIDRCYPLAEVADALRHVGAGHARGQTVIQMGE